MKNLLVLIFLLFCLGCKAKDVSSKLDSNPGDGVKPKGTYYFDQEELIVVNAAKKEAERSGYQVKKFRIYLDMHGIDSIVYFCPPKSDVSSFSILVESATGKILSVDKKMEKDFIGIEGK